MMGKTTRVQAVGGLDELIDRQIFLSGALDEGVKKFAKAKADAMPYLEIADTIDEARDIKTQAEAKATELATLAAARSKALDERELAIASKETELGSRLASLERNEINFASVREAFERKMQSHYEIWAAEDQELRDREAKASVTIENERKALEAARYTLKAQKEGFESESLAREQEHGIRMEALANAEAALATRVAAFEASAAQKRIELDGLERDLAAQLDRAATSA